MTLQRDQLQNDLVAIPRKLFVGGRAISSDDAKREILACIDEHGPTSAGHLAVALRLNYMRVHELLAELRDSGTLTNLRK